MSADLSGLAAFLAVADRRSFTAAAARLRVTPSAVSQSIRALEERVGVRLLQRTTRSVGLTEAGTRFLERLRPAMADVDAAFESLNELRARPAGTLRLNVPRVASATILEPILSSFLAAHPDIVLDVTIDDALADIVAGGFDAGIRLGETLDKEMVAVRISDPERVAIVGSPAYFAERGKPKHPRDLHRHACINYRRITGGGIYDWELTENGVDVTIAVGGRLTTNDAALMIRAAEDGLGLAYLLESTVRSRLADKRLVRVLEPYCTPFPGYFLYYPSRAHLPLKLRALIDFLGRRVPRRRATT